MSKVKEIKERTELTERQHEIFDWICQFRIENDYPPSIREIGKQFNFSEKAAFDYVNTFAKKGWISVQHNRPRSIKILQLASIFYGTVGELPIQIAPNGTVKKVATLQD